VKSELYEKKVSKAKIATETNPETGQFKNEAAPPRCRTYAKCSFQDMRSSSKYP